MLNGDLPSSTAARAERARLSLTGLSVGDAFGQQFFVRPVMPVERLIELRAVPRPPWDVTDDTIMAMAVVEVLEHSGRIDQEILARHLARKYDHDPGRGYGGTAHHILRLIWAGEHWRDVSGRVFGGTGSMGNGAAMRVAPLGAWYADDRELLIEQAIRSAEVTHAHPEGQAGAVAIALAAAFAWNHREQARSQPEAMCELLMQEVLARTPASETRDGIAKAAQLPSESDVGEVASAVGNGSAVLAQDTVPLCLWCAARHMGNYEEALWTTVSALGDRDTTCAIVGGIVALSAGREGIPDEWLAARGELPRV